MPEALDSTDCLPACLSVFLHSHIFVSLYLWVPYLWTQPIRNQKYMGEGTYIYPKHMDRLFLVIPWKIQYNKYLCSIYIVLGTVSNQDDLSDMRKMHRLNVNTIALKDLSICRFWYLLGRRVLELIRMGTEGSGYPAALSHRANESVLRCLMTCCLLCIPSLALYVCHYVR